MSPLCIDDGRCMPSMVEKKRWECLTCPPSHDIIISLILFPGVTGYRFFTNPNRSATPKMYFDLYRE